ncbi:hypothetical protein PoB_001592700 [Plakobranchus ocellatus]|uniref:Uncharacterized protein n=1 Tax=Plakobranchus ocellatus TaxID=259542 RepID=A0AAV3Z4I2_9GAST|nr:hypothetical protein PoB_001592700 [Plakobranchus ocellatus]
MRRFLRFSSRAPRPPRSPTRGDTLRGTPALCQGYPGAILPAEDSTWEEKVVEDSRRRSRRDDSAGKEVGTEDKSQVEKEMSPSPEREAVHRRQPALVASYDPRQPLWSQFFPRPYTWITFIESQELKKESVEEILE